MFFYKKSRDDQQKEIELTVLQLEKLIERAVDNAKSSIVAFDTSFDNFHDLNDKLSNKMLHLTELSSAHRQIKNNEKVLSEIEEIFKSKQFRSHSFLRENLKNAKEKNHHASIMFGVYPRVTSEWVNDQDAATFLVNQVTLERDFRDDLVQVLTSLEDFQDLFRKQYSVSSFDYVHKNRLDELSQIVSDEFDLSKFIRICEELNSSFQNGNYLSVAMLVRALLDHVPPIFGFDTFVEVANNYGGKSLKKSLQSLQTSSRNIADAHLHTSIRNKESLPNETQVDFRNDLDVLLAEVVKILK